MISSPRFGLLAAALLAACSIRVEQGDTDAGQDAECLELFETCVELAGESPGCTEVFEFCQGSIAPTGTGSGSMPGSCEQNYIDCLADGSSADDCQPLLDACMPVDPTTGCDPLEPGCTGGVASADTGTSDNPGCDGADPSCDPRTQCEDRYQLCLEVSAGEPSDVCEAIRAACEAGDCDQALGVCQSSEVGQQVSCEELTGCQTDNPPTSCDDLLAECAAMGVSPSDCGQIFPDSPECFPESQGCEWYQQECQATFTPWFCGDAEQACQAGWLPENFECGGFFPDACGAADLTSTACDQVEQSCSNGFQDVDNCAPVPIYEDPYSWLAEFAACNGWE